LSRWRCFFVRHLLDFIFWISSGFVFRHLLYFFFVIAHDNLPSLHSQTNSFKSAATVKLPFKNNSDAV